MNRLENFRDRLSHLVEYEHRELIELKNNMSKISRLLSDKEVADKTLLKLEERLLEIESLHKRAAHYEKHFLDGFTLVFDKQ